MNNLLLWVAENTPISEINSTENKSDINNWWQNYFNETLHFDFIMDIFKIFGLNSAFNDEVQEQYMIMQLI